MFRFIIRMFQKLLAKDWSKIIVNWIWIYQYVKKYWLQIIIYTGLNLIRYGIWPGGQCCIQKSD